MMQRIKSKQSGGFTIVEVMVVLAVVGVILMAILIAVPALQRNARNDRRKKDVHNMAALVLEYVNTRGGIMPSDCSGNPGPNCDTVFLGNHDLSLYETKNVSFKFRSDTNNDGFPTYIGPGNEDWITIANYYKCQKLATGDEQAIHQGASYESLALIYELETANGVSQKKCQEA